jgi:hypothetical protein
VIPSQPVVSTANVAQLAADLLITSLSLRRIGIFDPEHLVPVIGGREDQLGGFTTPLERACSYFRRALQGADHENSQSTVKME